MSTSTLNRLAPTQVELDIPISTQELAQAEERAFRKMVKTVRVPGFRQGKVPRRVFEQNYGANSVTSAAIEDVVPDVYAKAVREHDLIPVDRPKMEIVEESDGRPRRLKVTVEVRPEIELQQYKGLHIAVQPFVVSDVDVDRSIEALAKERGTLVPVDRPAEFGDVVTIDYEGSMDATPFEGGSATGQVTELREGQFIPGLVEGIVGMRAGERKDIEARFPDEYAQQNLAGKDATFAVTLHDVKTLEVPAIDDAFAKTASNNETVSELRDDVRRRLEALSNSRARRAAGNAVMERLLAAHDIPLPPTLVDAEIDHMMNDAAADASRSGTAFEEYLQQAGQTQDDLRTEFRAHAESRVKATLLIERIAKEEGIVATPADVADELEALARQYRQPVAKVREALGNGVLALMDGIVRTKALEFLVDNAAVDSRGASQETSTPAS